MSENLSHDEELEKFKNWWRESGQQLLLMIALVAGGYFGWQFWEEKQQQKAESGYRVYQELLDTVTAAGENPGSEQQDMVTHLAVTLKNDYSGSQYAYYASLFLAAQAVDKGDLEMAASELQTVMNEADEGLSAIARLRLSRVEADRQGADAALTLLQAVEPIAAFASSYAEAKGDYYLMKGDRQAAHDAYLNSLALLDESDQQRQGIITIKLNQVAENQPVQAEAGEQG